VSCAQVDAAAEAEVGSLGPRDVNAGAGYSLLLQRPSPHATYAGPPLVSREIVEDVRTVDVVLAHARDARLTRRAQAFADFCRETFTG
jgi:DNA-binding transcriptional LysR family regulator